MPLVGVRSQVRQLRLANPHWSLGDLAQETGVTRERVRQLLLAEGLPTRRLTPRAVFDHALRGLEQENHPDSPNDEADDLQDTVGAGMGSVVPLEPADDAHGI